MECISGDSGVMGVRGRPVVRWPGEDARLSTPNKKITPRPTRQEVEWNAAHKRGFYNCFPLALRRMQHPEGAATL